MEEEDDDLPNARREVLAVIAAAQASSIDATPGYIRRELPHLERLINDALCSLVAVGEIHNCGSVLRSVYKLGASERGAFYVEQSRYAGRRYPLKI